MLKSYKQLSRWYVALEPDNGSIAPAHPDDASAEAADDDGPPRYPYYIHDEDLDEERARVDVPADLSSSRSEFTGGWSDWVAGHAPGPDDHYAAPRGSDVVRFPWPDDEFDDDPGERSARFGAPRGLRQVARDNPASRRGRVIAVLVAAVLLLGVAAAGVLFLLSSSSDRVEGTEQSSMQFAVGSARSGSGSRLADEAQFDNAGAKLNYATKPQPGTGGATSTACPTERGERVMRSAAPGGDTSGPDAVLAFQYAYYVDRSGEEARHMVAPDALISTAAAIQRGIDSIPVGTTHCVRIVTIVDNSYSVEITEYRPGGVPATYNKQTVTTAVVGGRTLITGIAAG
ncbi:hypothetical protein [Nocardia australiensis]|uniref:hypothetical protein n=1 Tax=Nocardia australiensis TaxID=2887191 RepID=UPI001D156FE9|nr:hypothetical protein [Nocardia australiensis]